MNQLGTIETLAVGGIVSIVLWCGIVFPLGHRLLLVPLGLPPFWRRMRQDPTAAVLLMMVLLFIGAATIYLALVALLFLCLVAMFKVVFRWMLAGP